MKTWKIVQVQHYAFSTSLLDKDGCSPFRFSHYSPWDRVLVPVVQAAEYGPRGEQRQKQCSYNVTLRRLHELLLPWKTNNYYIFVCVCVCVRMCARTRMRARSLDYPACNSYSPYCDVICGTSGSTMFFDIIS